MISFDKIYYLFDNTDYKNARSESNIAW